MIAAIPIMVALLLASRGLGLALNHEEETRSAEEIVALGDALFHQNRYADAARVFQSATVQFADKPIPHLAYGHALFALGEFTASSKSLQTGIAIFPDWAHAKVDLREFFTHPAVFHSRLRELEALADKGFDERFLLGYVCHFSGKKVAGAGILKLLDAEFPGNPVLQSFLSAKTMVWIFTAPRGFPATAQGEFRFPRRRASHQPLHMEGEA